MGSKNSRSYSVEFKEQILKECLETNNYNLVARKHKIPVTIVYTWIRKNTKVSWFLLLFKLRIHQATMRNSIFTKDFCGLCLGTGQTE